MLSSNNELIIHLKKQGVLISALIEAALRGADRKLFVPADLKDRAYHDTALPIGHGQTISQPYTVVFMLEELQVEPGDGCLEIGAGSGWQTALLAQLTGPSGRVWAYEILSEIAEFGKANLARWQKQGIASASVVYDTRDAAAHWQDHAPYQRIISGAAFSELPRALENVLAVGGRLIAPTLSNDIQIVDRIGKKEFLRRIEPGFMFVPIVYPT